MLFETLGQGVVFLACAHGGLAIGVVYDAFKLVRAFFGNGVIVCAVADFLFWVVAGVIIIYVSLLANDGAIEFYMTLGFGAGYLVYASSISPILAFIGKKLSGGLKKAFSWLISTRVGKNIFR